EHLPAHSPSWFDWFVCELSGEADRTGRGQEQERVHYRQHIDAHLRTNQRKWISRWSKPTSRSNSTIRSFFALWPTSTVNGSQPMTDPSSQSTTRLTDKPLPRLPIWALTKPGVRLMRPTKPGPHGARSHERPA